MRWQAHHIQVQSYGRFLTKMVMPNIGAFIAWGLMTACFDPNGWWPNAHLYKMVGPMIQYMLPLLIGYTGGRMLAGARGGALGAMASMGMIVGTDIPMFLGAMIAGPSAGWLITKVDQWFEKRVPVGFEMLFSNFTAGIVGLMLAILGYVAIGPVVAFLVNGLEYGVLTLVSHRLLFLVSLIIEPGKILFLNNAINHGLLSHLGIQQAVHAGKSIFFLLEANPGPGLGILLAIYFHARNSVKQTAPTAMIIHFFGGIHEIYFPYVLANPMLFIAAILGGMSGVMLMNILGVGLVAMPSPGSIFAIMALAPKSDWLPVAIAITGSATVSFLAARVILRRTQHDEVDNTVTLQQPNRLIQKLVFACDTGMGSSAMGAALVQKMIVDARLDLQVENTAIDEIPLDADVVVTFEELKPRAEHQVPDAMHIGITDFLEKDQYDAILAAILPFCKKKEGLPTMTLPNEILMLSNILIHQPTVSKEEAIRKAGQMLLDSGYVTAPYIEGMLSREAKFTTYIGNGVAIPHGENEVKSCIDASGIVVIQYPEGIDFGNGNRAKLVIGIAGKGNEHIQLLSNIAEAIEDEVLLEKMTTTQDPYFLYELLS